VTIQTPVIGPALPLAVDALSLALYGPWSASLGMVGLEIVQEVRVWLPGRPVPKGRPRAWNSRIVTPPATRAFESQVAAACRRVEIEVPTGDHIVVGAHVVAIHKRTGREMARKRSGRLVKARHRADLDNVIKSVLDGVQRSPLLVDDSHVVALHAWRTVAPPEVPKLEGVVLGLVWCRVVDG